MLCSPNDSLAFKTCDLANDDNRVSSKLFSLHLGSSINCYLSGSCLKTSLPPFLTRQDLAITFFSSLLRNIPHTRSSVTRILSKYFAEVTPPVYPTGYLSNGANGSHLTHHIRDMIPGAPILGRSRQARGCHARTVSHQHRQLEVIVRFAFVEVAGV